MKGTVKFEEGRVYTDQYSKLIEATYPCTYKVIHRTPKYITIEVVDSWTFFKGYIQGLILTRVFIHCDEQTNTEFVNLYTDKGEFIGKISAAYLISDN